MASVEHFPGKWLPGAARRGEAVRFLVLRRLAAFINWAARIVFSTVAPFEVAVIAAYAVGMMAGFVLYRGVVWT